jgi:DNA mismatch endonuclease (patch repair protein)
MPDIFTPEKRSQVMSRIRSRDTKPELAVRSILHRLGFRFTVNGPKNRSLPGKPDIVLPKHRTVVFVHGCFWHGHPGCKLFRIPKSRTEFWTAKIDGNRARDERVQRTLQGQGWTVVDVWECELENQQACADLADRLFSFLSARN